MTLNDYQDEAGKFAIYKNRMYPLFGLAEEVGEFQGKIARRLRKGKDPFTAYNFEDVDSIRRELGDILWMLSACCNEFGLSLEDVAATNISKLTERKLKGVIDGEGDNR